jgi:hypothetical protein
VIISTRFPALMLAAALACSQPAIEVVGGKGGPGGGNGGGSGNGTGGKNGGNGTGGAFNVNFGDGGVADGSVPNPLGEANACVTEAHQAMRVPVDLLLLLDISGSMEESAGGTQSKWTAMHDALVTFIKDPMSTGLGVGLETFPPPSKKCATNGECVGGYCEEKGVCNPPNLVATTEVACNDNGLMCALDNCTKYGICAKSGLRCVGMCAAGEVCNPRPKFCVIPDAGCDANAYQTPIVAVADLPGAGPALETAMAGIVPQGTTPTTPAVTGALTHLRTRATANPDRKQVLVLATDGLPTECTGRNSLIQAQTALRTGNMGAPAIPTYVIGIFGSNQITRAQPALEDLATAGGTMTPFTLTAGGTDLSQRFLAAINEIRGATLGCEFNIPKPNTGGALDYDKVNVQLNVSGGTERLGYAGSMAGCDPMRGGWYYDADPKMGGVPTHVVLCEASCQKVKMPGNTSVTTSVDLQFGCKTEVIK